MPDVKIMVPRDAVAELELAGIATRQPAMRGPELDALVTVGTDSAALVTLLQAPDAVRAFAAWICGRRKKFGDSIEVSARRDGRSVHLVVDGGIEIEAVTEFLAKVLGEPEG
jgi:hypothetical protein